MVWYWLIRTTKMWDSMFKCQKGGRHSQGTNNGVHLCGFDNEDLVDTLNTADECDCQKHGDEHMQMRLIAGRPSLTIDRGPQIIDQPRSFTRSFSRYSQPCLPTAMHSSIAQPLPRMVVMGWFRRSIVGPCPVLLESVDLCPLLIIHLSAMHYIAGCCSTDLLVVCMW